MPFAGVTRDLWGVVRQGLWSLARLTSYGVARSTSCSVVTRTSRCETRTSLGMARRSPGKVTHSRPLGPGPGLGLGLGPR
ncbi:hypothetical protein SGFS_044380 [Streptomyces graminofaciens]|uniref:Secreted protein n=1 Tax=Streptomyces graminofaciens TaxID=68212 RepID=A0ABM7FAT3_9ACTN|nr:hypothetical protein SGFS_044380 [Streptomyces graminofaciens]